MIDGKQDVSNANELQITSSRFHVNQPLWKKANRLEIAAAISFIYFFFCVWTICLCRSMCLMPTPAIVDDHDEDAGSG